MTAGRGWIALALVVFASWRPTRVLAGAYLFGAVSIGQFMHRRWAWNSVAIPLGSSLSRHDCGTGDHIAESQDDAHQHAGFARQILCPGTVGKYSRHERQQPTRQGATHEKNTSSPCRGHCARRHAAPASAAGMDKVKACFIYVGPVGDFGWSYQHDQGRLYAEEKLGDKLETAYLESVPEGADAERAIERFARSGCNIIFTTSFGYMDPTNKVAKDFPDVKFEHATGYKTRPSERRDLRFQVLPGPLCDRPDRSEDVGRPEPPATSPPSRFRKSCRASTRSCLAHSRSIRISSSRSSGSTPGLTRARKPMPPRHCSTRASTS
jgi:hypothetical protein